MSNKMKRGALIVLEGCDKSGKTTQGTKLVERLNKFGMPAEFMRFPDRSTTIGKLISQYLGEAEELDDHAVHLLFSANRWELVSKMRSKIENGITLIIDRYAYSGVAFSSFKKGMNLEWCQQSDVGIPKPDIVFFLDLNVDKACSRGEFGGERYESKQIQTTVRDIFMKLKDDDWKIIDADKSIEELQNELFNACQEVVNSSQNKKLGQLWVHKNDNQS